MPKQISEFLELFTITPNIDILDLNNGCDDISKALNELIKPFDGKIVTINTQVLNELKIKVKRSSCEYGVISNSILQSEDKHTLMKIITTAIRDSGYIVILEEKEKSLEEIYELLEEFDFGAISSVDIFEKYNLIIGKKLHMWGMN